jgi:DNA-binding transcriptional regulator YbjK
MPPGTRERSLEAAVQLLGVEGVRALTHVRVDQRAGLPPGSTSNWFRTRRALLVGVVDWIVERELEELDPSSVPADQGLDGFLDGLCTMVELQIEPYAVRTRARYALFLELAGDLEIGERLQHGHRQFQQWTEQMLATLGIPDPVVTSRALMALLDGLLLHRLILDPDLDIRLAVERAMRALAAV